MIGLRKGNVGVILIYVIIGLTIGVMIYVAERLGMMVW